jgi:hypothetical protein
MLDEAASPDAATDTVIVAVEFVVLEEVTVLHCVSVTVTTSVTVVSTAPTTICGLKFSAGMADRSGTTFATWGANAELKSIGKMAVVAVLFRATAVHSVRIAPRAMIAIHRPM